MSGQTITGDPDNANTREVNERTPLVQGIDVGREFEQALRDEEEGATLQEVFTKRPFTVILALFLFGLVLFAGASLQSLKSEGHREKIMEVAQIEPLSARLVAIRDTEVETQSTLRLSLDYDKLGNGSWASLVRTVAPKLSAVDVRLDDSLTLRAEMPAPSDEGTENGADGDDIIDGTTRWGYVARVNVVDTFRLSLKSDELQEIEATALISDIGRPDVIGCLVTRALRNRPLTLKATGKAVVSKFGLTFRVPFSVVRTVTVPKQTTEDFAQLSQVNVSSSKSHEVNVSALANATLGDFPLAGLVPKLKWKVKIPGCSGELETLCGAENEEFEIDNGDGVVDIYFNALIHEIPQILGEPCDASDEFSKSPIDIWVSQYLAGEVSTIYIEGDPKRDHENGNKPILRHLLSGFDAPFSMFGKPETEHLITSITMEDARFGNQVVVDQISFSGKAMVEVELPHFLVIDTATVVVVTGVRGVIQLFTEAGVHFGQIIADNWMQTITLATNHGYKVTCYFDNIPTMVTNSQAFAEVSRKMMIEGEVPIRYDAVVDVQFEMPVGGLTVKKVRIRGATDMRA